MKISPPCLVVYGGCTYERAIDIMWDRRLPACEPAPRPVKGIWFHEDGDLLLFKLEFSEEVDFAGCVAIIPPNLERVAGEFLADYEIANRVTWCDLLLVRYGDTDDREVFEEELGLVH